MPNGPIRGGRCRRWPTSWPTTPRSIRLARRRGVDVDVGCFDVPERGRAAIEQALVDRGVNLPRSTTADGTAGR